MRISGPVSPITRIASNLTGKQEAFSAEENAAPAGQPHVHGTPASQPAHPLTSVNMLVALSAVDPDREKRRKMAAPARRGLDLLEDLHTEVLVGNPSSERLEELALWVRQVTMPEDERLARLIADIELRVRVELAKLDIEV